MSHARMYFLHPFLCKQYSGFYGKRPEIRTCGKGFSDNPDKKSAPLPIQNRIFEGKNCFMASGIALAGTAT
jgi:hypothetical protein